MPIRFRCCYCEKLLSISRRKAGTVTVCPTCQGQIWVPDPRSPSGLPPPVPLPPGNLGSGAKPLGHIGLILSILGFLLILGALFGLGIAVGSWLQKQP